MIDLHCHILPGFDDGPASFDETYKMLEMASEDGIEMIAATSHLYLYDDHSREAELQESFQSLTEALRDRDDDKEHLPDLVIGGENRVGTGFLEAVEQQRCQTLGDSRWLLVEISSVLPISTFFAAAYNIQQQGYKVLWAHVERVREVQKDVGVARQAVERGIAVQVNAGALAGDWGRRSKGTARALVRAELVHVLASDGHGPHHRPPILSKGVKKAERLVKDAAKVRALVKDNPAAILADCSAPSLCNA